MAAHALMTTLVEKISAVMAAFDAAGIPAALGGALALAYATEEPRGTRDIDVNVFVDAGDVDNVFAALPVQVAYTDVDRHTVIRDDQVRLWWDDTPVDLFFSASDFHADVGRRSMAVTFADSTVRVLAPDDLCVFKVLFDRTKDWADIEAMLDSGTVNVAVVAQRLQELLGDDDRISRLLARGAER